jgi:subtilisin family serine protease
VKLRCLFPAAMLALASSVGAQQAVPPTQFFSVAMRSVEDSAFVYAKLAQWRMTVMLRYELSMALRGRVDSMPPYPLDSLRLMRDSLGVLEYAEFDRTTGVEAFDASGMLPSWGLDSLRLPRAWQHATGLGVKVAVMDTGFETEHPEFAGRVAACVSFVVSPIDSTTPRVCRQTVSDCNHHGTHVASTVMGATRGVAPGATLYALKIFDELNGDCVAWSSARSMALTYARNHGVQTANFSTGGLTALSSERNAVDAAKAAGMVVCGSSGNNAGYQAFYPGAFPNALAIGALTSTLARASYSNRDTLDLDFAFPGGSINGAIGASSYGTKSGTSMASPHCAGYFALLKEVLPTVSVDSLIAIAKGCTKDLGNPGHDPSYGWGLPRADCGVADALGLPVEPTSIVGHATLHRGSSGCLPVDTYVEWSFTGTVPGVTFTPAACGLSYTVAADAPLTDPLNPPSITLIGVP